MNVTKDTRCDELLRQIKFPGKDKIINPVAELSWQDFGTEEERQRFKTMLNGRSMREMTIDEIADVDPNWNNPSMLFGMQAFCEYAQKDNFYYDLYKGTPLEGETALMAMTVPGNKRFVVICAGGGYGGCCTMVEAFPLAAHLVKNGISAFVLYYRVGKLAHYPNPMDDLAAAIRHILDNAAYYGVQKENYGVMGFSAGGHLAATFGTESIGYQKYGLPKPGCMFLGYPVITLDGETHGGSRKVLLCEDADDPAVRARYSVEKQATKNYPPTFLWQCSGDPAVPVSNSAIFAEKLKELGVKHVYEVFDAVAHSWGLGTGTLADGWLDRAIDFWNCL